MVLSGVFPLPGSPDLGRLVQDRLNNVHQQFPALCPRTLDDFRVVAERLSAIADVCRTVTNRLAAQDEKYNAAAAFKQVERALDWADCKVPGNNVGNSTNYVVTVLDRIQVDQLPSERTLLFRAHDQAITHQAGVYTSAARRIPFNEEYRQRKSVHEFVKSLGMHLRKKEIEAETGKPPKTMFTSTSPRLEWTLHLAGKKSRELADQVDFVSFDLQALRKTPDTTVFRVTDVLQFLETSGQTYLIPQKYRQWARNCDEYIIMGNSVEEGIVQVVPWPELRWMSIINEPFCSAYTLSTYEQFRDGRMDGRSETECGEVCQAVVKSAKAIAGGELADAELVGHLVRLILKAGVWFWGIKTWSSDAEIEARCKYLLDDELVAKMSGVSL
jgi:hypothetical protein